MVSQDEWRKLRRQRERARERETTPIATANNKVRARAESDVYNMYIHGQLEHHLYTLIILINMKFPAGICNVHPLLALDGPH